MQTEAGVQCCFSPSIVIGKLWGGAGWECMFGRLTAGAVRTPVDSRGPEADHAGPVQPPP